MMIIIVIKGKILENKVRNSGNYMMICRNSKGLFLIL